jgi:hypothetical protein
MKLVKLPIPAPSIVKLSDIVGVGLVLQHTPRAVTVAPPSEVILPPLEAVVCDTSMTSAVVNIGTSCTTGSVALSFEHETTRSNINITKTDKTTAFGLLHIIKLLDTLFERRQEFPPDDISANHSKTTSNSTMQFKIIIVIMDVNKYFL